MSYPKLRRLFGFLTLAASIIACGQTTRNAPEADPGALPGSPSEPEVELGLESIANHVLVRSGFEASGPCVAVRGDNVALAYHAGRGGLYVETGTLEEILAEPASLGHKITDRSNGCVLLGTNAGYILVWVSDTELFWTRLDTTGNPLGTIQPAGASDHGFYAAVADDALAIVRVESLPATEPELGRIELDVWRGDALSATYAVDTCETYWIGPAVLNVSGELRVIYTCTTANDSQLKLAWPQGTTLEKRVVSAPDAAPGGAVVAIEDGADIVVVVGDGSWPNGERWRVQRVSAAGELRADAALRGSQLLHATPFALTKTESGYLVASRSCRRGEDLADGNAELCPLNDQLAAADYCESDTPCRCAWMGLDGCSLGARDFAFLPAEEGVQAVYWDTAAFENRVSAGHAVWLNAIDSRGAPSARPRALAGPKAGVTERLSCRAGECLIWGHTLLPRSVGGGYRHTWWKVTEPTSESALVSELGTGIYSSFPTASVNPWQGDALGVVYQATDTRGGSWGKTFFSVLSRAAPEPAEGRQDPDMDLRMGYSAPAVFNERGGFRVFDHSHRGVYTRASLADGSDRLGESTPTELSDGSIHQCGDEYFTTTRSGFSERLVRLQPDAAFASEPWLDFELPWVSRSLAAVGCTDKLLVLGYFGPGQYALVRSELGTDPQPRVFVEEVPAPVKSGLLVEETRQLGMTMTRVGSQIAALVHGVSPSLPALEFWFFGSAPEPTRRAVRIPENLTIQGVTAADGQVDASGVTLHLAWSDRDSQHLYLSSWEFR